MTVDEAVALGKQIAVQEHFGVPKAATRGMTAEQLTEEVSKLQAFGAWNEIASEQFWQNHQQRGFDVAIAPHIRGSLGIPEGIHPESPASKIMEDAGEMQNFGLDITDRGHWNLFGEYRAGGKSPQDLIDVANASGKNRSSATSGGPVGGNGGTRGNGNSSTGSPSPAHPGGSPSRDGGAGLPANPGSSDDGNSDKPAGSQTRETGDSSTQSGGVDMQGDTIEPADDASYVAVVTHNDDGSFTVDIYRNDGTGETTKVNSETYTDADGDGSFEGNNGGSSAGKPAEGTGSADEDENGNYSWSASSSESSSSDDSGTDSDAGDTGDTGTEANPDDKYTPGPDGGLYHNYEWMVAMYQRLSDSKFDTGRGGKDSTPNPMNESSAGTRWWNPKDSVVRPIDGSSSSSANIPNEALQQIQDPNAVQGGVIDPVKRKDQ